MTDPGDYYTQAVRKEAIDQFGNWPPYRDISVGDYGTISGNYFTPRGNVTDDFGIEIDTHLGRTTGHEIYQTSDVRQIGATAEGGDVVGTKISFGREGGVYCIALGCTYEYAQNLRDLEQELVDLLGTKEWNPEHAIVTHLIRARSTTILISAGSEASIVLHANGKPLDFAALSKARGSIEYHNEHNLADKILSRNACTPVFTAKQLQLRYSLLRSLGKGVKRLLTREAKPHIAEVHMLGESQPGMPVLPLTPEAELRPELLSVRERYYRSLEQ